MTALKPNCRLADVGSDVAVWRPGEVLLPEAGQVCGDSSFLLLQDKLPLELMKTKIGLSG
jgi:hypothetical protein